MNDAVCGGPGSTQWVIDNDIGTDELSRQQEVFPYVS